MKYKAGDKVRVVRNQDSEIEEKKELVGKVCEINEVREFVHSSRGQSYWIWNTDKSDFWVFYESDLAPVEKTLYTLEVGDVLIDNDGDERIVLEVLTQSCLLSYINLEDEAFDWYTFKELEAKKYKVKQTQPTPLKMTVKQIAEKLGHEVEIVKE